MEDGSNTFTAAEEVKLQKTLSPVSDKDGWAYVYHEDHVYKNALVKHFKKETPIFSLEHRMIGKDGTVAWHRTRGKAIWDDNGRAIRFNALIENIDEQKKLEQRLAETEKSISNAIDNINTGIILWDAKDKMVVINTYMKERFFNNPKIKPGITYREFMVESFASGLFSNRSDKENKEFIDMRVEARKNLKGAESINLPRQADGR